MIGWGDFKKIADTSTRNNREVSQFARYQAVDLNSAPPKCCGSSCLLRTHNSSFKPRITRRDRC